MPEIGAITPISGTEPSVRPLWIYLVPAERCCEREMGVNKTDILVESRAIAKFGGGRDLEANHYSGD